MEEKLHLQSDRVAAPGLLQMQQMCFSSSFCKGELLASESKVQQNHLFYKALGLSSLKILRQYLVKKIIPSRKYIYMLFILKQLYSVGQFTGDIIAVFII